jgi:hypothetical protein
MRIKLFSFGLAAALTASWPSVASACHVGTDCPNGGDGGQDDGADALDSGLAADLGDCGSPDGGDNDSDPYGGVCWRGDGTPICCNAFAAECDDSNSFCFECGNELARGVYASVCYSPPAPPQGPTGCHVFPRGNPESPWGLVAVVAGWAGLVLKRRVLGRKVRP